MWLDKLHVSGGVSIGPSLTTRPPARPLRHVSARKTGVCHREKTLTHRVFVMTINHCDGQPSRPRLQGTLPRKIASVPTSEGVRLTGGHGETPWAPSSWRVASRLFRSRSAGFLCEFTALLRSVWITIGSCGFYASSPVWMGLVCQYVHCGSLKIMWR